MWLEKFQVRKTNKIAALHPSCKFIIVCLFSVCSLTIGTIGLGEGRYPLLLIPYFLILPILCKATGIMPQFLSAMKKIGFVAGFIFIVQSLLIPGEVVLYQLGFLKIYQSGLKSAITLSFSILNIAGVFVWMFQCTSTKEIGRALEEAGLNHKVAYVFISTFQMIDILGMNSKTIMNAQRARGVETEGNMFVRIKAFFPSLVPLILGAITGSEERVLTLESKGFDVDCKKTHIFNLEKSGYEGLAMGIAIAGTLAVIIGRILLWVL